MLILGIGGRRDLQERDLRACCDRQNLRDRGGSAETGKRYGVGVTCAVTEGQNANNCSTGTA